MYKNAKPLPSLVELEKRFEIDPTSSSGLRWKFNPGGPWAKKGDPTGRLNSCGYYQTKVNGVLYLNSRLIWKMVNGKDPEQVIDHIDNNPSNNVISNLRDISQRENVLNRKDYKERENDRSFTTYVRNLFRTLAS
jgi:hypothetical protein